MADHAHLFCKSCGAIYCDDTPCVALCERCGACCWIRFPAGTRMRATVARDGQSWQTTITCFQGMVIPRARIGARRTTPPMKQGG